MKRAFLKLIAAVYMFATAGAAAAQAQTATSHRPAAVPANYVITPFGYFHPSCVVRLAKHDEVRRDEKIVRHADGTSTPMHACAFAHYRADGESVFGDERGTKNPNISHAWIEDASVTTTTSFGQLSAQWSVPPTPTSNDGQTLFIFPGLEDIDDVVTIVQPVLGWNSDYASAWGIASWNCCESGTTYEAAPQPVNPGDTILGYMFDTCAAGTRSCGTWDIVTWDLQSRDFSELLETSSFGQTFNWAFAGALEVYNIAQCSDFPSNGGYIGSHIVSMNQVELFNDRFAQIGNPGWRISTASGLTPSCGYGGATPKQVILNY